METLFLAPKPFKGFITSTVENGLVTLSGNLYNAGGDDLSVDDYKAITGKHDLAVMTGHELDEAIAKFNDETYLSKKPKEISFDRYMELLEALPPAQYVSTAHFERFNMIERTSGSITLQVIRLGRRYYTLYVDVTDHTTWVTASNANEHLSCATPLEQPA